MAKYKDIMDRIELTDEMRERVLINVKEQAAAKETDSSETSGAVSSGNVSGKSVITAVPVKKVNQARKNLYRSLTIAAACLIVAGGIFFAWKQAGKNKVKPETDPTASGSGQVPSVDLTANGTIQEKNFDSIDGINEALGLNLSDLTKIPFVPQEKTYSMFGEDFAEIYYTAGIDDECIWRIGKNKADITALCENFPKSKDMSVDGIGTVSLYGETDGFYLAVWNDGTYYHSIQLYQALSEEGFADIVREISG